MAASMWVAFQTRMERLQCVNRWRRYDLADFTTKNFQKFKKVYILLACINFLCNRGKSWVYKVAKEVERISIIVLYETNKQTKMATHRCYGWRKGWSWCATISLLVRTHFFSLDVHNMFSSHSPSQHRGLQREDWMCLFVLRNFIFVRGCREWLFQKAVNNFVP